MTCTLLVAPASAGKTAYVVALARQAAQGLRATPRLVVPTRLQVRAVRRRLAEAGGAMGVRVLTFDGLYADCLRAAGEAYTELSEPVQYRLIRAVVDDLRLEHYAPLVGRPGFIQVLERLIGELKAARIDPEAFAAAVDGLGAEPRLAELARIYAAYQARLQAQGWADRAGLGWLAVEALERRAPHAAGDWPLLVVDGFDDLTTVQVALIEVLARRAGQTIVTLTGTIDGAERPLVHRRFDATRRKVEAALGVEARPLPQEASRQAPALAHLEAALYRTPAGQVEAEGAVELVEAPDRAAEVRAALRWLKARLVEEGMRPGEVALLARSTAPYRPFVLEVAAEFGLPVRLLGGLPLRANPAVAALLDLLRLAMPSGEGGEMALPRRLVVEAWRSPYFDWGEEEGIASPEVPSPMPASQVQALDAVARWGRVIGGLSQWEEALEHLGAAGEAAGGGPAEGDDDERGRPAGVPRGHAAQALRERFRRFVQRLTPPAGEQTYRAFVGWLEDLIGPDPALQPPRAPAPEEVTSLRVVARARRGPPESVPLQERDVAALEAVKEILRGLVWAEEALGGGQTVTFAGFLAELAGAVEAATYLPPADPARDEIVVGDVVQARGVPFRAAAVVGLGEGEFPAVIGEDPFLRDADRAQLSEGYDLGLEPSTLSAEAEFFYETVTRARERLLLTRPRLADNGAPWEASPFWEEVRRLVRAEPEILTTESAPPPDRVASWPELMQSLAAVPRQSLAAVPRQSLAAVPRQSLAAVPGESLAAVPGESRAGHGGYDRVRAWVQRTEPRRAAALEQAARLVGLRSGAAAAGEYEGDLREMGERFARQFGPDATWSASGLEAYRTCPFYFFAGRVLGLEPREEPAEGLDARQLGNIYHRILERVYQAREVEDPTDAGPLVAALPGVAKAVLDAAPEQEGFRETAWWAQTRAEIEENVRRSLEALAALPGGFAPVRHEAVFGMAGQPALTVRAGADRFRLRGFIDRIDRAPDGRVRVIDYKTAGPWRFDPKAVAEGKKLQVPLYALAACEALGLGDPAEGFYWHVQQAEPSGFQMSRFDGGPEGAMEVAVEKAWEAVRGARDGFFAPQPPVDGCPSYCPAAGFCWRYQAGYGG